MKVNLVNENFKSDYLKNLLSIRGVDNIGVYLNPPDSVVNNPKMLDNIDEGV